MFRKSRKSEESQNHKNLERNEIIYYIFVGCFLSVSLAIIINSLGVIRSRRNEAKEMEHMMKTVHSYMTLATDDEYDEYTRELRNELMLSAYNKDQWQYAQYIDNTADSCGFERNVTGQVYIAAVNTGCLYSLDIDTEDKDNGNVSITSGYDEISGGSIIIQRDSGTPASKVSVSSKRGIISVQRMKQNICDSCIEKILDVNGSSAYPEFVLYDNVSKKYYPLEKETAYQIGDHQVDMYYERTGEFRIQVSEASS